MPHLCHTMTSYARIHIIVLFVDCCENKSVEIKVMNIAHKFPVIKYYITQYDMQIP